MNYSKAQIKETLLLLEIIRNRYPRFENAHFDIAIEAVKQLEKMQNSEE